MMQPEDTSDFGVARSAKQMARLGPSRRIMRVVFEHDGSFQVAQTICSGLRPVLRERAFCQQVAAAVRGDPDRKFQRAK